jgi:Mu transposase-like protein
LVHQRVELRFDRDRVWIRHAGSDVASYPRSYEQGQWFPPPQLRPEAPARAPVGRLVVGSIAPPELADYAELCA